MENSGLNQNRSLRYNYIQLPNFQSNLKKDNNTAINNNNYLCQSQEISNKSKENPLTISIADKIKEMKEELSKDNYSNKKKDNNEFRKRLEKISKGKFVNENKENRDLINTKKGIDLKIMKNRIKKFEVQREKEKAQTKNAFDELDNIFNNFRNNRYNN